MIFSCGSNGLGQLGLGHDEDTNRLEAVFEPLSAVRAIECGGNHTLVLCCDGTVWASGDNTYGQCGHEGELSQAFVAIPGKWRTVACGWEFSVLVGDDGIYTCGYGPKGELGRGKTELKLGLHRISDLTGVEYVGACMNHVVVQTSSEMWGWGVGRKGQLGPLVTGNVFEPTRLDLPYGRPVLGRDFTVVNGGVYGKFDYELPTGLQSPLAMWSSVHWLDQTVQGAGNNRHGQVLDPPAPCDQFTTGSEHGIMVRDDEVLAWGWGEHGNCGVIAEGVVTGLNSLGRFDGIEMIAGGQATTWVVARAQK